MLREPLQRLRSEYEYVKSEVLGKRRVQFISNTIRQQIKGGTLTLEDYAAYGNVSCRLWTNHLRPPSKQYSLHRVENIFPCRKCFFWYLSTRYCTSSNAHVFTLGPRTMERRTARWAANSYASRAWTFREWRANACSCDQKLTVRFQPNPPMNMAKDLLCIEQEQAFTATISISCYTFYCLGALQELVS